MDSTKAFHWQCRDNNPSIRRRMQSPPFPLFQVHADRWTITLHILCCLETTHQLYICRWNWTVVQGTSCPLWGDFAQTPSHTSIKTSRQATVHSLYPPAHRPSAEISARRTRHKLGRPDTPAPLRPASEHLRGAPERSRTKYVSL